MGRASEYIERQHLQTPDRVLGLLCYYPRFSPCTACPNRATDLKPFLLYLSLLKIPSEAEFKQGREIDFELT